MFRTVDRYEEDGLGLPYPVTLIDGAEEQIDDDTGEVIGISIPAMETLVAAVAITRARIPVQLSGDEVRFIRGVIGVGSKAFAEALEMDPATFSRWENGRQTVGAWADKQVRMAAVIMLADRIPGLSIDPKEIVKLHILPAPEGFVPQIEMVLRHVPTANGSAGDGWDTNLRVAA